MAFAKLYDRKNALVAEEMLNDRIVAFFEEHQIYTTLEQLQSNLDAWITYYNTERLHVGKMCCGRNPMQTFFDSLDMAKNRMLDNLHSADIAAAA